MKLHRSQTEFNCGIDLHTTNMYACVMNKAGDIQVHKKVAGNDLDYLSKLLEPYAHDLTVCCESTVNWYFLYDFCNEYGVRFALGHALYMRAISQAKVKNDKVDSQRIADLLRTNLLPEAYTCPKEYREARDLMRKRTRLVQKRSDLKTSLTMSAHMHGHQPPSQAEKQAKGRRREAYLQKADTPLMADCYDAYLDIIECFDEKIRGFENLLLKYTRNHYVKELNALTSAPGMGRIAALTIIYESGEVNRFKGVKHYCSYARVSCNEGISNDKSYGTRGRKMGNKYLKWIFEQAAVHASTHDQSMRNYRDHLRSKHGKLKARNMIAHRLARFAYFAIKDGRRFDIREFLKGKESMIKRK